MVERGPTSNTCMLGTELLCCFKGYPANFSFFLPLFSFHLHATSGEKAGAKGGAVSGVYVVYHSWRTWEGHWAWVFELVDIIDRITHRSQNIWNSP